MVELELGNLESLALRLCGDFFDFYSHLHFTAAATAAGLSPAGEFYGPITGEARRRKRSESHNLYKRNWAGDRCVTTIYTNNDPSYQIYTCQDARYTNKETNVITSIHHSLLRLYTLSSAEMSWQDGMQFCYDHNLKPAAFDTADKNEDLGFIQGILNLGSHSADRQNALYTYMQILSIFCGLDLVTSMSRTLSTVTTVLAQDNWLLNNTPIGSMTL